MAVTFLQNELPPPISSPLKFISVISKSPNLQASLNDLLSHTYYLERECETPLEIFDFLADSHSKFYSVTVRCGDCKLVSGSACPNHIHVTLDEHTYFHNGYIGVHSKVREAQTSKRSLSFGTFYHITVERCGPESFRLEQLCYNVFSKSTVEILSDIDVSLPTDINVHKHKDFILHQLATPVVKPLAPTALEGLDPVDRAELYELLSLVHLNALPDRNNPHVAATLMYELPKLDTVSGLFASKLFSYTSSHVNPLMLYEIANMPEVDSVQAVSATHTFLLLKSDSLYTWSAPLS